MNLLWIHTYKYKFPTMYTFELSYEYNRIICCYSCNKYQVNQINFNFNLHHLHN